MFRTMILKSWFVDIFNISFQTRNFHHLQHAVNGTGLSMPSYLSIIWMTHTKHAVIYFHPSFYFTDPADQLWECDRDVTEV